MISSIRAKSRQMSRVKALQRKIHSVGSEAAWRLMSFEELERHFINEMLQLPEDRFARVIQRLSDMDFDMWRKKLWDAQDIPPDQDGYNRSMPVMLVLKRSLLLRVTVERDATKRRHFEQQLSLLSLILNPEMLSKMGFPMDEDSTD